jgi:hypothetical protein
MCRQPLRRVGGAMALVATAPLEHLKDQARARHGRGDVHTLAVPAPRSGTTPSSRTCSLTAGSSNIRAASASSELPGVRAAGTPRSRSARVMAMQSGRASATCWSSEPPRPIHGTYPRRRCLRRSGPPGCAPARRAPRARGPAGSGRTVGLAAPAVAREDPGEQPGGAERAGPLDGARGDARAGRTRVLVVAMMRVRPWRHRCTALERCWPA